ncbi:hypothetical protein Val02_17390 [Virgisporangium aliadipatigenens]|uniref:Uncharacterized protein n=1 Tax=Virgisporangium aliadipatigenens TaxID=741659 RepID=A0A8J3YIL0_9ACTN|nr:hypothetical protein Val02_17390 [Virgisporangium aliadipatigenens]
MCWSNSACKRSYASWDSQVSFDNVKSPPRARLTAVGAKAVTNHRTKANRSRVVTDSRQARRQLGMSTTKARCDVDSV